MRHCESNRIGGKTLNLRVKYSDFTQATRSRTVALPFMNMATLYGTVSVNRRWRTSPRNRDVDIRLSAEAELTRRGDSGQLAVVEPAQRTQL
ncbi:hypothetical protein [Agrobacterium sp. RS6]|uniref:DinB/UmuC family translesion DNA polymerase n=1 Tax=Agrobacterium sp. RS6 TaxID=2489001 RepID=UPI00352A01F1